jgi:hypothetical protein
MDGLNPALELLLSVKISMERGESVRQGLLRYLKEDSGHPRQHRELRTLLSAWLMRHDQGLSTQILRDQLKSPYRRNLLDIIERGLRGEPVLNPLLNLEVEIIQACHEELERRLLLLPLKALIPLLFLQFPALAILFLSPLLSQLSQF